MTPKTRKWLASGAAGIASGLAGALVCSMLLVNKSYPLIVHDYTAARAMPAADLAVAMVIPSAGDSMEPPPPARTSVDPPPPARASVEPPPHALASVPVPVTGLLVQPRKEVRVLKACAAGCEKHGTCNPELGRCDCAPFMGGDDCSRPLFAACAQSIGLREVAPAPCVYERDKQRMAPVSCACLQECESLGLMNVRECYVVDPQNATVNQWISMQRRLRGLEANTHYWQAALRGQEETSVKECGGRGVYAPPMPNSGAPSASAPRACLCYASFSGTRCEKDSTSRPLERCLNGCSRRGKCVRNWCHCADGFYGIDCSVGASPPGAAAVPALPVSIGAQVGELAAGAPKVYIYELPPRYNSWMHAGANGWWQDLELWGEDVVIHRQATRDESREHMPFACAAASLLTGDAAFDSLRRQARA
jgi:hypothetical protein